MTQLCLQGNQLKRKTLKLFAASKDSLVKRQKFCRRMLYSAFYVEAEKNRQMFDLTECQGNGLEMMNYSSREFVVAENFLLLAKLSNKARAQKFSISFIFLPPWRGKMIFSLLLLLSTTKVNINKIVVRILKMKLLLKDEKAFRKKNFLFTESIHQRRGAFMEGDWVFMLNELGARALRPWTYKIYGKILNCFRFYVRFYTRKLNKPYHTLVNS